MKKKLLTGACAVIAVYMITAVIFSCVYPKAYLKNKYPNAEITSSRAYNGDIGGLFERSTLGYRFAEFELYDAGEDISFGADFELVWYFPFYRSRKTVNNFEVQLEYKNKTAALNAHVRETAGKYTDDVYAAVNPCDGAYQSSSYGCHIFVKKLEPDSLEALIKELDRYVEDEWFRKNGPRGDYISYSLYVCMDDALYDKLENADFSSVKTSYTGQAYCTDMLAPVLGTEPVRISSSHGYSEEIYKNLGDKNDSEYRGPDSFEHLLFWYDSEPNANGKGHFYLFGIN